MACNSWESYLGNSMSAFGLTNAGEWSFAINDCGEFLNGVGLGTRWEGSYLFFRVRVPATRSISNLVAFELRLFVI